MWIFGIGKKKNIVARILVLIVKNIFFIFFVKLQLIAFVELGCHNVRRAQSANFIVSYIISMLFCQLMAIEIMRAWILAKRRYKKEELEKVGFDGEIRWMYNSWTSDLKEKEKKRGNTFMVRNRIRWSIF